MHPEISCGVIQKKIKSIKMCGIVGVFDLKGNHKELKALEGVCNKIEEFLPGHYLYSKEGIMTKKSP